MRRKKRKQQDDRTDESNPKSPFRFNISFKTPIQRTLLTPSSRLLERMLLFNHLDRLYAEVQGRTGDEHFTKKLLDQMNVSYDISAKDLARLPKTGPVIVAANHPFGGIEAAILAVLLRSVRDDFKILANYLLHRVPEIRDTCFFVDPFGTKQSKKRNIAAIKDTTGWLRDGHMLGVFPAGEVSHMSLRGHGVVDSKWNASIARMIKLTEAPVVPLFIEGRNGMLFQVAGMLHPRIRTAMLPHELLNKRNRCVKIFVGDQIPHEKLAMFSKPSDMMDYLRFRTYVLANKRKGHKLSRRKRIARIRKRKKMADIAPAEDRALMFAEIQHLPKSQLLLEGGDVQVHYAKAEQIRHLLHEIGRLREVTFRAEHEGTGTSRDLDRFDEHYLHLFAWNKKKKEIVGAYRIGQTDEIMAQYGKKGLYTSTLFKYKKALLKELGPALELGRSFVCPEYQKNYSSLLMLWKGICLYVSKHPKYTKLFGPVSISNEYHSVSRRLLVMYLKANDYENELAKLIKPKHPLRARPIKGYAPTIFDRAVTDIGTISSVIAEIESGKRGVPILLKQYLRLGGKLLGFNRDPDFSDVLDGLILVDFLQTDPKQLQRLFGKEGIKAFRAHHGLTTP